MSIQTRTFLRHAILAAMLTASGAYAQSTCPEGDARQATEARDLTSLSSIYEDVQFNPACSDALREEMRLSMAELHMVAAGQADGATRVGHLKQAATLGRRWEYRAALGEALLMAKDYEGAATALQTAINRLNDNPQEGEIDARGVHRLIRLASTAVALADEPVAVPVGRSGAPGGVFSDQVRGFAVKEVPVRITFDYDSDEFTEEGAEEAERFAGALIREAPEAITLEGHTDAKGSEAYNLDLSRRRAEAMRALLIARGFTGEVQIVAKGETEPPDVEAGLDLNEEEIDRLSRRVELVR